MCLQLGKGAGSVLHCSHRNTLNCTCFGCSFNHIYPPFIFSLLAGHHFEGTARHVRFCRISKSLSLSLQVPCLIHWETIDAHQCSITLLFNSASHPSVSAFCFGVCCLKPKHCQMQKCIPTNSSSSVHPKLRPLCVA